MKTQSMEAIPPIQDLGDNSYYIHKNVVKKVKEEIRGEETITTDYWEADTVRVDDVTLAQVTELAKIITL